MAWCVGFGRLGGIGGPLVGGILIGDRVLNVALAAVYAVTIVGSAVGEWGYFVLGSAAKAVLLGAVVYHAWTWRESAG